MKYSEAMNPDKGVRSTRCAHWCRRYCWWQQVCSIYAGKHAHIQPSFSLTCPAFSLTHTWKNWRVCVCLPHALWSPATRLMCSSAVTQRCYCSLAMLNRPSSTQTHTGCQLAPTDMAKNNGERRKRVTVEIKRETRQEVKLGHAESSVTKKKIGKGVVDKSRDWVMGWKRGHWGGRAWKRNLDENERSWVDPVGRANEGSLKEVQSKERSDDRVMRCHCLLCLPTMVSPLRSVTTINFTPPPAILTPTHTHTHTYCVWQVVYVAWQHLPSNIKSNVSFLNRCKTVI